MTLTRQGTACLKPPSPFLQEEATYGDIRFPSPGVCGQNNITPSLAWPFEKVKRGTCVCACDSVALKCLCYIRKDGVVFTSSAVAFMLNSEYFIRWYSDINVITSYI